MCASKDTRGAPLWAPASRVQYSLLESLQYRVRCTPAEFSPWAGLRSPVYCQHQCVTLCVTNQTHHQRGVNITRRIPFKLAGYRRAAARESNERERERECDGRSAAAAPSNVNTAGGVRSWARTALTSGGRRKRRTSTSGAYL